MIFLDNASTTRVLEGVDDVVKYYNSIDYFNPSASYALANEIANKIREAKRVILKSLNGSGKLIFTGSATESNNTVLLGQLNKRFKKVLVSRGEHSSISHTIQTIKNAGFEVEEIPLTHEGIVDLDAFKNLMSTEVGLVSVIHVSNETGAINPIKQMVQIAKQINPNVLFHSDGVQAFLKIPVNLDDLGVDFYTISGHKVHAPKGIAGLYIRKNLKPYLLGGGQQDGLRGGTENVSGIMALKYVVEKTNLEEKLAYVKKLRDELFHLLKNAKGITINSSIDNSPYVVSLTLDGVNGETMVHALELNGILVSTGSACSSKSSGNNTLSAMGLNSKSIRGNLRVSFDIENTIEDVRIFVDKLIENYNKLTVRKFG